MVSLFFIKLDKDALELELELELCPILAQH
jgi:hypothetical protein